MHFYLEKNLKKLLTLQVCFDNIVNAAGETAARYGERRQALNNRLKQQCEHETSFFDNWFIKWRQIVVVITRRS